VKFIGKNTPSRSFYCGKICKTTEGFYFLGNTSEAGVYVSDQQKELDESSCEENEGKVVNIKDESILCALKSTIGATGTGITFIDFIIENAVRVAQLFQTAVQFFNMFLEVIIMLILLFLYDSFVEHLNTMNETIFGSGFGAAMSALPSLKEAAKAAAGLMANISNIGTEMWKSAGNRIKSANKDKKASEKEMQDKDEKGEESGETVRRGDGIKSDVNGSGGGASSPAGGGAPKPK
ncbi:MAG: hypothetical protein LBG48_03385, partial [Rickettsiales bacterium]|nr:hypothetical protein [Rickettsiales bacterium]